LPRTVRLFMLGGFIILRSAETPMKTGKLVLWIVVAVFALIAVNSFWDSSSDPNTRNLVRALGRVIGTVFGVAAAGLGVALLLWRK